MAKYSNVFKLEAIKMSDEIGVKKSSGTAWITILHTGRLEKSQQA